MKRKICTLLSLIMALSAVTTASATRRRYEVENAEDVTEETEAADKDYGDMYYTDVLYGGGNAAQNNKDFEGYHYNGVPIKIPDFNRFEEYTADQIHSIDDAIKDYLGWDFLLGTSDMVGDTIVFKRIPGVTAGGNSIFGYGRKKFGHEKIDFKLKVRNDSGTFDGKWLGITFLCETTQTVPWSGNKGYVIAVKEGAIELQKWLAGQNMLINMTENANFIKHDVWQDYSVDIKDIEGGINITFKIDGQEVFSFDDTTEPQAPTEGYFNIYCNLNETQLKAATPSQAGTDGNGETAGEQGGSEKVGFGNKLEMTGNKAVSGENTYDIPAVIERDGGVLVPLRFITEGFGGMVEWKDETQTATVLYKNIPTSFTKTFKDYKYGTNYIVADAKADIIGGNFYVSAEALAEALGKEYAYNNGTVIFTDLSKFE